MSNLGDKQEQLRIYERTRDELVAQQMRNAESYDKSILSISSAFLILSLAFIKDVVPGKYPSYLALLYASWVLFALAIISTVGSIIYGQSVIKKLLDGAERYYCKGEQEAHGISKVLSKRLDCLNIISGVIFILAIIFTVIFVSINFRR